MRQNVEKAFLSLPGYEEVEDGNVEDSNCDSEDEIADFELTSYSLEGLSFEHHTCFSHTLQLVIKDEMKVGQINNVLKRCSKLVAFVRKSTIATDLLEGQNRLLADNATRWNSQLTMIKSFLSIPESKLSMLEGTPPLTTHDRNILKDIVEILTPFQEATDFVQVSCVPFAGYIVPCVKDCNIIWIRFLLNITPLLY